ncbi:MAG: hypothetical protein K6G23_03715 [Lachnospiraceae bacterium]|nr:hypothetical protein [Lachnospiraceae bacterium]
MGNLIDKVQQMLNERTKQNSEYEQFNREITEEDQLNAYQDPQPLYATMHDLITFLEQQHQNQIFIDVLVFQYHEKTHRVGMGFTSEKSNNAIYLMDEQIYETYEELMQTPLLHDTEAEICLLGFESIDVNDDPSLKYRPKEDIRWEPYFESLDAKNHLTSAE